MQSTWHNINYQGLLELTCGRHLCEFIGSLNSPFKAVRVWMQNLFQHTRRIRSQSCGSSNCLYQPDRPSSFYYSDKHWWFLMPGALGLIGNSHVWPSLSTWSFLYNLQQPLMTFCELNQSHAYVSQSQDWWSARAINSCSWLEVVLVVVWFSFRPNLRLTNVSVSSAIYRSEYLYIS